MKDDLKCEESICTPEEPEQKGWWKTYLFTILSLGFVVWLVLFSDTVWAELTLDLGLGVHNRSELTGEYHDWRKVRYPSIDYASNPLFLLNLSYKLKPNPYIDSLDFLHISSVMDQESNYGFNMVYVKTTFTLFKAE